MALSSFSERDASGDPEYETSIRCAAHYRLKVPIARIIIPGDVADEFLEHDVQGDRSARIDNKSGSTDGLIPLVGYLHMVNSGYQAYGFKKSLRVRSSD